MKQTMEGGVSAVLSSVVEEVGQSLSSDGGAQVLHELLSAPWLSALLKMYESLLQFQRLRPSPLLPFSTELSHEILCAMSKIHRPSAEARELFGLLCSPHIKALLWSHDSVAQGHFGPVLEPLPEDLPEDEEAVRIVCLVKNNQPLNGGARRGSVGSRVIHAQWSSLRHFTVERLETERRGAWSREELATPENVARLLPCQRGDPTKPFLPRYQSTGSCHVCPPMWRAGLHQSAPSVCSPAPCSESPKSSSVSEDPYSFPPPPVGLPVYSASLPSSPALCKKTSTYAPLNRAAPTPRRRLSNSVPCSPATQRSAPPQGCATLPARRQDDLQNLYSNLPQVQTKQVNQQRPALRKQRSIDELRSVVQTVASTLSHEDVRHLGPKMVAATELMTDNVEENAQALNLLVEVVDKLQGLIVASKGHTASPPNRPKQRTPPQPPRRVSSLSPKIVRRVHTPYPRPLSTSSSCSSCSSSSTSLSFCPDAYKPSRSDPKKTVTFRSGNSNGQVRLNNGAVSRAPSSDQYDCNTSCLTSKKKKKNFTQSNKGVGATIKRDEKTGQIYIARVIHGGLAERSGLLQAGDHLLEVNGSSVSGLDPEQVIKILVNTQGTILFKVIPNSPQICSSQKPVYMRAMVDYCPREDSSNPCPAAGVGFTRADVLEVVDQSDGQWWQARRLPSSGSCAGLIPSASNLKSKQREQWWCQPLQTHTCIKPLSLADDEGDQIQASDQCIPPDDEDFTMGEDDADEIDKLYIAGFRWSFRFWRRSSLRRRRQSCSSCCPGNIALATPYEEVTLYQRPLQDAHRLIVLVGASGVGVNELRKRLIRINPLIFQGPVPHTTRPMRAEELPGREYHFVNTEEFHHMLSNHRFVDYGEHGRHFYGTSFEAIEEVLQQGRICVIDVEPRSVQSLRTKALKPYVIFIKVPDSEKLRETRREAQILTKHGLNRNFTEEDFAELEETSKLIEAKYRQFFDSVLVNGDLAECCLHLCSMVQRAQDQAHWVPVSWTRDDP